MNKLMNQRKKILTCDSRKMNYILYINRTDCPSGFSAKIWPFCLISLDCGAFCFIKKYGLLRIILTRHLLLNCCVIHWFQVSYSVYPFIVMSRSSASAIGLPIPPPWDSPSHTTSARVPRLGLEPWHPTNTFQSHLPFVVLWPFSFRGAR